MNVCRYYFWFVNDSKEFKFPEFSILLRTYYEGVISDGS